MAKRNPIHTTPTNEIRDGLRKFVVHIEHQRDCVWWTARPEAEVSALIAKRNKALLSAYNFNSAIDFD